MNNLITRIVLTKVLVLAISSSMAAQSPGVPGASFSPPVDSIALSLQDAIDRGLRLSEEVRLARSRAAQAGFQIREARSGLLPELTGQLTYQHAIKSPNAISVGALPDSLRFDPDPTASLDERVRYLERNTPNAGLGALTDLFRDLPFGQKNTWVGQIDVRQPLFDGTALAGVAAAREYAGLAAAQRTEEEAELELGITEAYYGALLAERLVAITEATAVQLDDQLAQVRLVRSAGNASDLDLLRVQVDRQNIEPDRVAAQNQRELAVLEVKRLINLPADTAIRLDQTGADSVMAGFRPLADAQIRGLTATAMTRRAAIVAAERQVGLQEQNRRAVKASYLPSVSLTASFGAQALPSSALPSSSDFRSDWRMGAAVRVPIFTGGRRSAQIGAANEALTQAELQLTQQREFVALEIERQAGELRRAQALITARAQTTAQAVRVYDLTDLAYRQGVSTNLQLTDARLSLNQARTNEVRALHDYFVALARLQRAAGAPITPRVAQDPRPAPSLAGAQ